MDWFVQFQFQPTLRHLQLSVVGPYSEKDARWLEEELNKLLQQDPGKTQATQACVVVFEAQPIPVKEALRIAKRFVSRK